MTSSRPALAASRAISLLSPWQVSSCHQPHRWNSLLQFSINDPGHTTSTRGYQLSSSTRLLIFRIRLASRSSPVLPNAAVRKAMTWMVLPSPMSSPRIPPRWYTKSSCRKLAPWTW